MRTMSEKRGFQRMVPAVELECRIGGERVEAKVLNLSIGGAMLDIGGREVNLDALVSLRIVGLTSLIGKVRWLKDEMVGVQFKTELHPSVVAYLGFDADAAADIAA